MQKYLVARSASWPLGRRGRLYREVFATVSAAASGSPTTDQAIAETKGSRR
jgi:hypothetical protein